MKEGTLLAPERGSVDRDRTKDTRGDARRGLLVSGQRSLTVRHYLHIQGTSLVVASNLAVKSRHLACTFLYLSKKKEPSNWHCRRWETEHDRWMSQLRHRNRDKVSRARSTGGPCSDGAGRELC